MLNQNLLYLKVPDGIERDSGGNLHFLHGSPATFYTNQYQVAPKVGDTYLWPSWLQHFVYPYKCEGERWVMPFNLVQINNFLCLTEQQKSTIKIMIFF